MASALNILHTALIYLVDKIAKAIDEKEIVLGVFSDFSKAFDTINHKILFSKLNHYGIRGVALDWIQSYLNNRSQFVCFNYVNSSYSNITCGVPQWSILGPLLFLIHINDLSNISTLLFTILFADDTNIFLEGKNIDDLVKQMNLELSKIVMWLEVNRLSLNIKKTHFMRFATGNHSIHKYNEINQDIKINNIPIDRVHSTKFLGVYIDSKLNWSEHIKYIRGKISKSIIIICKARTLLNGSTLVTLYNSFVLPYIWYCIEVWGNTFDKYLLPLFRLQKRVIRLITFSCYIAHTSDLFKDMRILTLSKLYILKVHIFMYKFENNTLKFPSMFTTNSQIHTYPTRTSSNLHIPIGNLKMVYKMVRYSGVKIWNNMKYKINISSNFLHYKFNLRQYLLAVIHCILK